MPGPGSLAWPARRFPRRAGCSMPPVVGGRRAMPVVVERHSARVERLSPRSSAGAGATRCVARKGLLPTRVVDPGPHGDERLDGRRGRNPFLVSISGYFLSLNNACHVLAPHELVRGERAHGLKQLGLAVANVLQGQANRTAPSPRTRAPGAGGSGACRAARLPPRSGARAAMPSDSATVI